MEETLKKLKNNKISIEQNGHNKKSVSGKENPHLACSQPSMMSFPPWTETPPKGKQSNFEEMQE